MATNMYLNPSEEKTIQLMIKDDNPDAFLGLPDLHVKNRVGDNLLQIALSYESEECVKYLIQHAPSLLRETDKSGITALENVIELGFDMEIDITKYYSVDDIHRKNGKGDTLIHIMVERNRDDLLEKFLSIAPNPPVNEPNNLHETPLHYVIIHRASITCAKILMEYGADPFYKKSYQLSAFDYATLEMKSEYIEEDDVIYLTKIVNYMKYFSSEMKEPCE